MKRLLLLATSLFGVFSEPVIYTECRNSDIKSIIGGPDYEVDEIRGVNFIHLGREQLLVFGRMTTDDSIQKGFLFIYDYLFCESREIREAPTINDGFREAYYDSNKLYLLGYTRENGNLKEVVSSLELELDREQKMINLKQLFSYRQVSYLTEEKAIQKGFFKFGGYSHIVVTPTSIRRYVLEDQIDENQEQSTEEENSEMINIAATTDNGVIALLRADSTSLALVCTQNLEGGSFMASTLTIVASIQDEAMMLLKGAENESTAIIAVNIEQLTILMWTVRKATAESEQTQAVLQFEFNEKLKVIHLSSSKDQSEIQLIAIDESNQMWIIKLSFDGNSLTVDENIVSEPLNYFDYKKTIFPGAAQSNYWDFWFCGVTDVMTVKDQTLRFSKPVGFIMSTQKNRLNEFWQSTESDLTLEINDQFQAETSLYSIPSPTSLLVDQQTTVIPHVLFRKKNDWIDRTGGLCDVNLGIENVDSTCYYYDIFKHRAAVVFMDLRTLSKQIPRQSSYCNRDKFLDYGKYAFLSDGEKVFRNICYPKQKDTLSSLDIPVTNYKKPMVQVDKKNYQLYWLKNGQPELGGNYWSIRMEEFSDDFNQMGFNVAASFQFKRVSHINLKFDALQGKQKSFAFFPKDQSSDFDLNFTCWSLSCPSYIKMDENSIYTDVGNQRVQNNTYLYYIQVSQKSKKKVIAYTLSFNVTSEFANSNTKLINITYDFYDWYAENKAKLPFYAPPPIINETKAVLLRYEDPLAQMNAEYQSSTTVAKRSKITGNQVVKTELQSKLDPKVFNFISDWSDTEIAIALQEAKERLKFKQYENIPKITIDQKGQLQITFQGDIKLPSYLKKEIDQHLTSNSDKDLSRKLRRDRRLSGPFQEQYLCSKNDIFCEIQEPEPVSYPDQVYDEETVSIPISKDSQEEEEVEDFYEESEIEDFYEESEIEDFYEESEIEDFYEEEEFEYFQEEEIVEETQECDPLVNPSCSINFCDDMSDPICQQLNQKQQMDQTLCDPTDPKSGKIYDPKSECYKPVEQNNKICPTAKFFNDTSKTCEYLKIYFGSFDDLFDVKVFQPDQDNPIKSQRRLSSQLIRKLVSFTNTQIVLQLQFPNPIEVSPDDFLLVTTNLTSFNPGITMSERRIPCTRQVINGTSIKTVEAVAGSSQVAVIAAAISSVILQTSMQAGLSQMWGMINGIQYILHIPCVNLEFPANAFLALKQLISVATFQLPYMNTSALKGNWRIKKVEVLTDLPSNLVQSFDQLGYNDNNISNTMGTLYFVTLATLLVLMLILVTLPFKCFNCCNRFNLWMRNKLLWNFVIRLILEESLETMYAVSLTFKYSSLNISYFGSAVDYIVSIILIVATISLLFFMAIFYLKYYKDWENQEFQEKYGEPLNGLKKDQKSSLIYPVYFLIRRAMFCTMTLVLYDYVMLQLILHFIFTIISLSYLTTFVPQEKPLEYRLELLNEYFTLIVIDICFFYTDLDSDRNRQYQWGYLFIVAVFLCVGIQVILLLWQVIVTLILRFKKARKVGFKKTFQSTQTVKRIVQLLAFCKKRRQILPKNNEPLTEGQSQSVEQSHSLSELVQSKEAIQISEVEESYEESYYESYYDEEEEKLPEPLLLLNPLEVQARKQILSNRFSLEEFKQGEIDMMQQDLLQMKISDDKMPYKTNQSAINNSIKMTQEPLNELFIEEYCSKDQQFPQSQTTTRTIFADVSKMKGECGQHYQQYIEVGTLNQKKNVLTVNSIFVSGKKSSRGNSYAQGMTNGKFNKKYELSVKIGRVEYNNHDTSSSEAIAQRIQQLQLQPEIAQHEENKDYMM